MSATSPASNGIWLTVAGVVLALVYAWVAAGFRPFTVAEEVMVAVPIVLAVVVALRPRPVAPAEGARRRGLGVWLALLAAITVWELAALFSSPRDDHPTLSSIADLIMSVHVGRAFAFALWLAMGVALASVGLWWRARP